jgi:hypothetical protein
MENSKIGIAILFCNEKTNIDLKTVESWFEGSFVDRINPIKEAIADFEFISQIADLRYFVANEEIEDVNSLVAVIEAKPTGFIFARNSGLFTDYFFITDDEQVKRLKNWDDEENSLQFLDTLRYLK